MKMKKIMASVIIGILMLSMLSVSAFASYVAYWSFDDDATELVNGYVPSNPAAFKQVDGKNGKAFAGAQDDKSGIIVYDDVDIPFTSSFTCAVWAKGDSGIEAGGYFVMMAKNQKATDGHFEFYWNPGGSFSVYATNSDMVSLLESTEVLDDGQWHHYVIRVVENEWELYVDGALDVTYSAPEPLNIAAGPMFFGSLVDDTLPAQSALDDLLFLDYAVPTADIASIMNDTKTYAEDAAGLTVVDEAPTAAETPAVDETPTAPISVAPTTTPKAAQTSDVTLKVFVVSAIITAMTIAVFFKRRSSVK